MRPIKELLIILLEHKFLFSSSFGLCWWVNHMYDESLITNEERQSLLCYINQNRPSKFSSLNTYLYRKSPYYWNPGYIRPRIKWLKKHISKLKK